MLMRLPSICRLSFNPRSEWEVVAIVLDVEIAMRLRLRLAIVVVRAVRRWLLLDLHVAGQELALSALLAP